MVRGQRQSAAAPRSNVDKKCHDAYKGPKPSAQNPRTFGGRSPMLPKQRVECKIAGVIEGYKLNEWFGRSPSDGRNDDGSIWCHLRTRPGTV